MALTSLPEVATDEDLVRLANIVTGRNRTEQELTIRHVTVSRLEPYTKWLYYNLRRDHSDRVDAIGWFEKTVTYFSDNPDAQITEFLDNFQSEFPSGRGKKFMRELVLALLSYWLTIRNLHVIFDNGDDARQTIQNCMDDLNPRTEDSILEGNISVKELVQNGRLIPPAEKRTDPFKSINASTLNVHVLAKFGRLKVKWTEDISRHLEIVEEDNDLYLFGLPCIFEVQTAFTSMKAVQAFQYVTFLVIVALH
jgi:hypothetical protein